MLRFGAGTALPGTRIFKFGSFSVHSARQHAVTPTTSTGSVNGTSALCELALYYTNTLNTTQLDKLPLDKQDIEHFKVSESSKDGVDAGAFELQ